MKTGSGKHCLHSHCIFIEHVCLNTVCHSYFRNMILLYKRDYVSHLPTDIKSSIVFFFERTHTHINEYMHARSPVSVFKAGKKWQPMCAATCRKIQKKKRLLFTFLRTIGSSWKKKKTRTHEQMCVSVEAQINCNAYVLFGMSTIKHRVKLSTSMYCRDDTIAKNYFALR